MLIAWFALFCLGAAISLAGLILLGVMQIGSFTWMFIGGAFLAGFSAMILDKIVESADGASE